MRKVWKVPQAGTILWARVMAGGGEGNPLQGAHRAVSLLLRLRRIGSIDPQLTAKSEIYQVDTTDILFILSGAFVGLDKVVQQRLAKGVRMFRAAPHTVRVDP